jgi:hypothetical protein
MKKKTIQKLRLEKIKIANLSITVQQPVKGMAPTRPESVCICSWPTENC